MSLLARCLFLLALILYPNSLWAFDQFESFSENGKYGLINTDTREVVLQPEYDAVGWSKGSFRIYQKGIGVRRNGKWALASVTGEKITQHDYTVLYPFSGDLLIAGQRSQFSILNKHGVINAKGKTIIALEHDQLTENYDQLIAGKLSQGAYQYGLLSKTGKVIIAQTYRGIAPVEEGTYAVMNDEELTAIFTKTGKQLSDFEFEAIEAFDTNGLLVRYYNRKGLVSKSGQVIIPPIYKELRLENGKVRALPFQKWGLWTNGKSERSFFFDQVYPLSDNTFAVQTNEHVGIITREEVYIDYLTDMKVIKATNGIGLVSNGEYMGAIDDKGKLILPMNYDDVLVMPQVIFGRIKRQNRQDWQAFTHRGSLLSQQRYESVRLIEDGLIQAKRNGKSGLLDAKGNERTPFIYDALGPFTKGMSVVNYQGNQGVINTSGYWLVTPYKDSLAIHDQYILYKQGSEYGLLDFGEKLLFRTQDRLTPVGKSLLISHGLDGSTLRNLKGERLLEEPFDTIRYIHDDLFSLKKGNKLWLYRPSTQTLSKTPDATIQLGVYAEDVVSALIDGQWGFIGEQGDLRIANRYEKVNSFSEGLAAVKLIGKWGVINRREEIVIQPIYDDISPFYGGKSIVKKGDYYGMIDREGNLVLGTQYSEIRLFDQYILLETAGLYGLTDRKGGIVRAPQYDKITSLGKGLFLVSKEGKLGVINLKGEDKVPTAFQTIIALKDGSYLAAEPGNWITPKPMRK